MQGISREECRSLPAVSLGAFPTVTTTAGTALTAVLSSNHHNSQENLMSQESFKCPECGGHNIKAPAETQSLDDMTGALCVDCGREFTKDGVIAQAREEAINRVQDAIRKGLK